MNLSVIIPVYNEKETIEEIIRQVKLVALDKEIIIIDDASTDGTKKILKTMEKKLNTNDERNKIKIIYRERRQGKGSAIRRGLEEVSGDIVIIQDADLEYEPQDYYKLVQPIIEGKTDIVYGSRISGAYKKKSYSSFYLGGRFLSFLASVLYDAHITDEPTCYKVFRGEVIKSINLKCKRFEFCPEITAKVRKKGYRIYEVPIHYYPRSIEEGKKINWKDGLQAIWTLIKYRFID